MLVQHMPYTGKTSKIEYKFVNYGRILFYIFIIKSSGSVARKITNLKQPKRAEIKM
ncbi:hypothetical protein D8674_018732 [Pyrus ussuriensis x Pyrus communis]|uniref:Uncharacterized protein n=1 Tax=Pyrus ussuriensis x Pyrus communis TaxID=2448454 RepID=A0A5N5GAY7_9ROSA|nr:hypothetical protein D8674_018732 [Pyrus ussuriensis x Pyrus communis]